MATSNASTVAHYLAELPADRRKVIAKVRQVVRRHLPKGYRETMNWGMITYEIPLATYPDTYNKQPLCYAGLAAQKNYCALYLMCANGDPKQAAELRAAFKKAGKKLDMGKSCLRFRSLEDLPLDAIGRLVASTPPAALIAMHEKQRRRK